MLKIIVAMDEDRGIGKDGTIPWRLKTDLQNFRNLTLDQVVIMGRKTYQALPGPLPRRNCVVLTRSDDITGVQCFNELPKALLAYPNAWIIGGGSIFRQTLQLADELYVTRVSNRFNCDTFFPEFENTFEIRKRSAEMREAGMTFCFEEYATT
jgi:dihydrofolate reductase